MRRFSEDIDLSFDRAELGYTGDRDPEKEGISKKQAARLIDDLVGDVERHIAEKLLPAPPRRDRRTAWRAGQRRVDAGD